MSTASTALGLDVEEADQHPDGGRVLGLEQALGLGRPRLLGAVLAPQRGISTPNCQRAWFLAADAR
jgi:hypothetical protein